MFGFTTKLLFQLLEAMVERPPPRPLIDEFGMELDLIPREELSPLLSPELPDEPKKPAPRPYISRARSSEAVSPTAGHPRTPLLPSSSPVILSPVSPTSPIVAGRSYQVRSRSSSSGDATETQ
jgi:protein phosphatase 1 regulatory subunit 37